MNSRSGDSSGHRALVSFGANLGDAAANWQWVQAELDGVAGDSDCDPADSDRGREIKLIAASQIYQTQAIGCPDSQQSFSNAALVLATTLSAPALIDHLLSLEERLGRVRTERWGARLVDLDLLLFDQLRLESERYQVPHPRMTFRRFMLKPACEIAADWLHPLCHRTLADLVSHLDASPATIAFHATDDALDSDVWRSQDWIAQWKTLLAAKDYQMELCPSLWSGQRHFEAKRADFWDAALTRAPDAPRLCVVITADPMTALTPGSLGMPIPYLCLQPQQSHRWHHEIQAAIDAMSDHF